MAASFDPAVVAPLRVGKPELWERLVEIFMQHTTENLEVLDRALNGNDCSAVHMTAHSQKSSSANMGAMKLSDLFRQLEAEAKEGRLETGDALFTEIRREFEIVCAALVQDRWTETSPP
jgi:HPt (histidine-containing phosphotransfer) domain-containing protein